MKKKNNYWLSGGLIGLVVGILLLLTILNPQTKYCNNLISEFECTSMVINRFYCIFVALISTIIGAIIGFIIGKIKLK